MQIQRVQIAQVRSLREVVLEPGTGINLITGANGAGKTSVLEAIHLLAYGRSFRGRVRDGLVRTGQPAVEVFVEWLDPRNGLIRRAGLRHSGQDWSGRLDGRDVTVLGDLCAALAVVTFEPGSHALVSGGSEPRRRFLDWGLFHVEQQFLPAWRRYSRALKQRNALLKRRARDAELDVWDLELANAGEALDGERRRYLERLQVWIAATSRDLLPELGEASLRYQAGWRRDAMPLADALLLSRERDLLAGFTSVGPHRADWTINHEGRPGQETLSRGQGKLTALACLLAQAEDYRHAHGNWPVVLLDDMASELDRQHQHRLLEKLHTSQAQVLITGTEAPAAATRLPATSLFHVEHGAIQSRD